MLGNNHYVMRARFSNASRRKLKAFIGWLLNATKSYATKLVNPGGVENWKNRQAGNVADVDSPVDHFGVTPRQIIQAVAQAVDELKLPHAAHIHANNLGLPGNWTTTLETMKLLEGRRGHLTHIQFHSYGGGGGEEDSLSSKVAPLADHVNANPNITAGCRAGGLWMRPRATDSSATGRSGYYFEPGVQIEMVQQRHRARERVGGISPIEYKNTSLIRVCSGRSAWSGTCWSRIHGESS